jgi:CDGSH-type Zn-finger protein
MQFTLDEKKPVTLWACNYTDSKPFCDGRHAKL